MEKTKKSIRRAAAEDLPAILGIYERARQFMRENGNPNQWGTTYPSPALLSEDVERERLYLCEEGGEILGVFCYFEGNEPTYDRIDGAWLNDCPYGVLHRVASAVHGRGAASFCFAWAFDRCKNLKIDTHRDNLPMQNALEKNGFHRCGIIRLEDGGERVAYQKQEER